MAAKRAKIVCTAVVIAALLASAGCGQDTVKGTIPQETSAENSETAPEDVIAETEAVETIEIPEHVVKTVTITATGDCTLGKTQDQGYSGSFWSYYDNQGADYFFRGVKEVFEQDDMTLINLECVLSNSEDRVEKTFNLKGKPEYVNIMTGSSVEACSLGNNHTYDYGEAGLVETKQVLNDAGIVYGYRSETGVYTTEEGVKIGIVSCSMLPQSAEVLQYMTDGIQSLKQQEVDLIIACCHWGIERENYANSYQVNTGHALIDAGADLVVGNHPHVLQGVEVYNGKVICYSLGNFSFGGNLNPSDKRTMMYQQTFTLVDGEVQTDLDAKIVPCRLSSTTSYNDFQPTILEGEKAVSIIHDVNTYSASYSDASFDDEGILHAGEEDTE